MTENIILSCMRLLTKQLETKQERKLTSVSRSLYTLAVIIIKFNKEERYSRVPRLSNTRYSAKGTKGKWRYVSSKARLN